MDKISVIVPIYNTEKYLARCVDSILAQTFKDFELILIDDGSSDNSPKRCDEFAEKDKRIKVIHQLNQGVSAARNTGLDYAMTTDSKWITFIDSDDWVHPQYLEILYNACIENGVDISSCGFERIKKFFTVVNDESFDKVITDIYSTDDFYFKCYYSADHSISMIPTRLYRKNLFINKRFVTNKRYEDEYLTHKILFSCKKNAYINKNLYFYFYNCEGFILNNKTENDLYHKIDSLREQVDYFATEKYNKAYYIAFERLCLHCFSDYYKYKDNKKLYKFYKEIINYLFLKANENNDLLSTEKHKKMIFQFRKEGRQNNRRRQKNFFLVDFNIVKTQKNIFYAFLWALKNYRKYR